MSDRTEAGRRRAVIVTGAAAGIGWAAARRFAAGGDRIAILDRDAAAAAARAAELGGDHFALTVDVADKAALTEAIGAAHARMGRLDVLVNNAATIYYGGGPTLDLEMADYRKLIGVNIVGAEIAARAAAAIMRAQGTGGAIVNLASLVGVVAVPNRTAYSVSKAAMIGLTSALAEEFASSAIRVNAVLPGFTATETFVASQRGRARDGNRIERRIPLGRMAAPDEVAAAICHLASPDARFMVGAMLTVDGGFSAYGGIGDASEGGAARPAPLAEPRVALIAGAASTIGAAVAARLAAGGSRLALLDRASDALTTAAAQLPVAPIVIAADAVDRSSADAAVQALMAHFGRIDLLVNASACPVSAPFDVMLEDGLAPALIAAQATAPIMIRQGIGAIVNLCAVAGPPLSDGNAGRSAAHAGMTALTRSLACEWGGHGIRVNAVAARHADGAAAAIDFLGSGDASYVTGTTYVVDGGAAAGRSGA